MCLETYYSSYGVICIVTFEKAVAMGQLTKQSHFWLNLLTTVIQVPDEN